MVDKPKSFLYDGGHREIPPCLTKPSSTNSISKTKTSNMSGNIFESPNLLFDGARLDIQNFDIQCRSFLDSCVGIPFSKMDNKTGENVIKYRITPKIPGALRYLASNAINNLRHVLDQAVNSAAVALGSTKRNNYFPFAKTASELDGAIKGRCPTVRADLIPALKGFQPYGGGDDFLYTLNRLAGPNKHQVLLQMDVDLPHLILNDIMGQFKGPGSVGYFGWDSAKQEIEVARMKRNGYLKCNPKAKFPLFISVRDSRIFAGQPATAFLDALASKVDGILRAIEAETLRLL